MRHFSPTDLKTYLDTGKQPLLLDVREPWEFEICQIEGSQLLPMRQIPAKVETLKPDQEIVVICHHGIRSRQVGYFLERVGFTQVINLTGGVEAWAREVDNQMPTY
jgi:rhodanese-related sulfurtransferase